MARLSRSSRTWARSAACPHHHVATLGSFSSSPIGRWPAPAGSPAGPGFPARRRPSGLASTTDPLRTACDQPGNRRSASGPSSSTGSANSASRRRTSTSTRFSPPIVRTIDRAVAHRQVAALDQQEAEIAREIGVLEIGLVQRPRRQQADARRLAAGLRRQRAAPGLEERREPLHLHRRIEVRHGARERDAVLQRIAHAGGSLGAVAEHPPAAVRPAAEIGRVDLQPPSRRASGRPTIGPQEIRARRPRRRPAARRPATRRPGRRRRPARASSSSARCISPAAIVAPFGLGDHERHMAERPGALLALAGVIDAVIDAGVALVPVREREGALHLVRPHAGEAVQHGQPVRTEPAAPRRRTRRGRPAASR